MAQLVVGAAGAAVGFMVGGPVGASIGWSLGTAAGAMLFTEQPNGPRLLDKKTMGQQYGEQMWRPWGTIRGAGQTIWSSDLIEHAHTRGKGKRGGTTYSYTVDCAIAVCQGPVEAVLRIWGNGILIYDVNNPEITVDTTVISETGLVIYLGDEEQEPSALMESYLGAGQVPAYRGTCYVTFEGLQLERFGNRLPNFEFEVTTSTGDDEVPTTREVVLKNVPGIVPPGSILASGYFQIVDTRYIITSGTGDAIFLLWDQQGNLLETMNAGHTAFSTGNYAHAPGGRWVFSPSSNIWWAAIDTFSPGNIVGATLLATFIPTWVYPRDGDSCWFTKLGDSLGVVRFDYETNALVAEFPPDYPMPCYKFTINEGAPNVALGFGLLTIDAGLFYECAQGGVAADVRVPGMGAARAMYGFIDPDTGHYVILGITEVVEDAGVYVIDRLTREVLWFYQAYQGSYEQTISRSDRGTYFVASDLYPKPSGKTGGTIIELDCRRFRVRRVYQQYQADDPDTWETKARQFEAAPNGGVYSMDTPFDMVVDGPLDTDGYTERDSLNIWYAGAETVDGGPTLLSTIVGELLVEAGYDEADFDVAELTQEVQGFLRTRIMSARACISVLQSAYFFDLVEIDDILVAINRGGASEVTVPADDLLVVDADTGAQVEVSRTQDLELPRKVTVAYKEFSASYDPGTQDARRETTQATGLKVLDLPIVLTPDEARSIALVNLTNDWMQRDTVRAKLPGKYLRINPASPITLPLADGSQRRVLVRSMSASPLQVEIEGHFDDVTNYEASSTGITRWLPAPPPGQGIIPVDDTAGIILDTPLLKDADESAVPVLYWTGGRAGDGRWTGAQLYGSVDGSAFDVLGSLSGEATVGTTTAALADWDGGNVFDDVSVLAVRVQEGAALETKSELAVLNGANLCIVGDEVLQFTTATQTGTGTWNLTGLLRGRKLTEWAMTGHASGERFVMLDGALNTVTLELAEIGQARFYKPVTYGQPLAEAFATTLVSRGMSLKPASPVHVEAVDDSGDWVITWVRRTRFGGELRDLVDVPLNEVVEAYEVDIWNDDFTERKRVLTATGTREVTYTAAQQTADFGGAATTFGVRVYQMSDKVGRGAPGRAALPDGPTVPEDPDGSSSVTLPT